VKVPALINSAWYDIFQVGAFRNFDGMRERGGTDAARRGTKLIVGAYGHAGDSGTPTFGSDGGRGALLPVADQLPFFDRYLKGMNNGWENTPSVQLYVLVPPDSGNTGSGFWLTGASYPLPGTQTANLYLASRGHANTSGGDGQLVGAPAEHGPADRFDYDPANPVPTTGGNMCCNAVLLADGAQDQTRVEMRNDVLVYSTAPLAADVAVIGPVEVKLWARSSAPDTDFTAKLVDVHLDGVSHNVLDRVVRASLRAGSRLPPSNIEPGEAIEYTIPLGNAGTIFKKGHLMRLEISSSNFPHYARNLNTGKNSNFTSDTAVARQTILHDEDHPSRLVLSVAPGVHAP
jgi:putative CocE/NonD family hydrolase